MKFLKICASCVAAGRNVRAGDVLPVNSIPAADAAVLTGAGLARVVDLYPVKSGKKKK